MIEASSSSTAIGKQYFCIAITNNNYNKYIAKSVTETVAVLGMSAYPHMNGYYTLSNNIGYYFQFSLVTDVAHAN